MVGPAKTKRSFSPVLLVQSAEYLFLLLSDVLEAQRKCLKPKIARVPNRSKPTGQFLWRRLFDMAWVAYYIYPPEVPVRQGGLPGLTDVWSREKPFAKLV